MIQILAIREWKDSRTGENRKGEVWFDRGMRAPSVEAIFQNPLNFIEKTTPSERVNLYYTVAECHEMRGRKLLRQTVIPFDIDDLIVPDTREAQDALFKQYLHLVCATLGLDFAQIGSVFSGGGLQFFVKSDVVIEDDSYFEANRKYYKAICEKLQNALISAKLPGKVDHSVWSAARLMRYPDTINRKPGRPERVAYVINGTISQEINLKKLSGLPDLGEGQEVRETIAKSFPTPDPKAILSECQFMQYVQSSPNQVSEPEWYAALSIGARFPEGRKFCHQISKDYKGYSFHETETKITQSLENSGPRTCKGINDLWGKCQGCKHFKSNDVISPLLISGPGHVKTQNTGFHYIFAGDNGTARKVPDVAGLATHLMNERHYKTVTDSEICWAFENGRYEILYDLSIKKYAEDNFEPKPKETLRREFLNKVKMYGHIKPNWFTESTRGKMNFKNGVLDVRSRTLVPHSHEYGFMSQLPCEYDPNATAPRWEKFINEVTLGRQELIDTLQEYLGYVFSSQGCKYQRLLCLLGEGSNGKSTLVNVIKALAGSEGSSNLSIKNLQDSQNRAILEGKIINISDENDRDSFRNTELIMTLVVGGNYQIKRLFAQPYEVQNNTNFIMLCNKVPHSSNTTHGFFRRFLFIPFDAVFSHERGNIDIDIEAKLIAELPGIFNWIMKGFDRLEKQGQFTESKLSKAVLEQYREDIDPIYSWYNERIVMNESGEPIPKQEVYNDFVQYCQDNGIKFTYSSKTVFKFIKDHYKKVTGKELEESRPNINGERRHCYTGIKLESVLV